MTDSVLGHWPAGSRDQQPQSVPLVISGKDTYLLQTISSMKYNGRQQNVEEDGRIKGHLLGRTKERVRTNKISYGGF